MNTIKVKDFDSMQAITVSLARNGYMVTVDSVSDENYKEHWEIKYCEFSEIKEKINDDYYDLDGDCLNVVKIRNNDNTKRLKGEALQNEKEIIDPNPYGLMPRDNTPAINPHRDVSDNITDKQNTVITSISGN